MKRDIAIQACNKKRSEDSNTACGFSVIELLERAKRAAVPLRRQQPGVAIKEESNRRSSEAIPEY